jgi:hypothetical protein
MELSKQEGGVATFIRHKQRGSEFSSEIFPLCDAEGMFFYATAVERGAARKEAQLV